MRCSHLAAWVVVGSVVFSPAGHPGAQSLAERHQLRVMFLQRVDAYVTRHRELERLLSPEVVTSDLTALFAPRQALAAEMRRARARARQGDIFAPAVAVYFRVVIAETLWRHGITDFQTIVEDENTVHVAPALNGDYPAGRSMPLMLPCLLEAFPPLPAELRYSFIGRDLILWDMHAGLIADFVPDAAPAFAAR